MEQFVVYNLKVAACLAVFHLFYKLLLSRDTFHRLNRILLLAAVALSFVLPVCVITVEREMPQAEQRELLFIPSEQTVAPTVTAVDATAAEPEAQPFPWKSIATGIFTAGVALALGWTFCSLAGTLRIIRCGRLEEFEDGVVLSRHMSAVTPFSWGRWIVISEADYAQSGDEILAHERAHIRCGHSWDLLFTDLVSSLQWFNPAMWLLRAELRAVHEYEADAAVLEAGADAKHYQLLLIKKAVGGRWYSVANSLNHSNLKNRITMMLRKKSSRWAAAKMLVAVPLMCVALGAFARTSYVVPDGKDMENPDRLQSGFSGGMIIRSDEAGRMKVLLDGKGDAMMGAMGLIAMSMYTDLTSDSTKMREFMDILLPLTNDPDARELDLPRPLCMLGDRKLSASDSIPGAPYIATFTIFDKRQAEAVYGSEGANGAVVIITKRPDEPSEPFADQIGRNERERRQRWFWGESLQGGPKGVSMSGSTGGGTPPSKEEAQRQLEEDPMSDIPVENTFTGIMGVRFGENDESAELMLYGVNDAMMAAASLVSRNNSIRQMQDVQSPQTELARILYRLSRSAIEFPGLMAEPMPLLLVDGKRITDYDKVPEADKIAYITVLGSKRGAFEYSAKGANGVVRIVSTKLVKRTSEEIEEQIRRDKLNMLACMPEKWTKETHEEHGFYCGLGSVIAGFSSEFLHEKRVLFVLDGKQVAGSEVINLRPSTIESVSYIYDDPDEILRYGGDVEDYLGIIKIETIGHRK